MSIAELIMQGTQRSSESTAWVGDSLAKLGQNVGKVLADREQQKQAQEMLPMFQQSLQEAMTYANEGDAGLAYAKLMPFITNPATAKNPYTLPAIENAIKLIDASATQFARNIQVQAYRDRSSGGGGVDGGTPNPFAERFNQARGRGGIPSIDGLPTDTTGYNGMPSAPQTEGDVIDLFAPLPEAELLPKGGGVPAMQSGGGTSFGMRDSTTSFGAGAYQPSEETLQQFAEYSDQYDAAKPKQKKAIESQRTIVYDNKDALGRDIQNLDDDQFGFAQLEAGAADPTFVGIQFSRYKLGNVNAKGEQMYNPNTDADASIGRLQEAFNLVNDRTELKDIYTKAGGWKNIELKPIAGKQDEDGVKTAPTFEVINKKNPSEKIEVTEDEFSLLGTINKMIPTSQTNDMKIIRIGEEAKPTAEAPAETVAPTERPNLMDIAMGKPVTPSQQKGTAPSASTLDTAKINPENPFAKDAKKELETQALAKQVGETMRTQAKQITSTRQARDRIKEIDNEINKIKSGKKSTSPMLQGLKLSELNPVEKYQLAEKLLSEKKKLEAFLASN